MNKQTSNDMMEREFDILQSIQGMTPPANLYDNIIAKTSGEVFTVSKKWFAGAAAFLVVLICLEVFLVLQPSNSNTANEIEVLVQQENNQLYE